jgi:hypothetical protein
MPNNNVATICELWTTDEASSRSLVYGYRWMFKSARYTMVSNAVFTMKKNCKRSLTQFLEKHRFDYWDIQFKEKTQKSQMFLV